MSIPKQIADAANPIRISREALAKLGAPKVVYVKAVRAEDLADQIDDMSELPADADLFAVHAADGTPMALVDGREAAFATALQYELEPVSVH
jgi:hypothetical protein